MHWMRQQDKSRFLKFFIKITQVSHLINGNYLKRASPKAANIHNRWWRERSERNLRFNSKIIKRPRRGRTQATCANIPYVRPLRGRSYHYSWNRRLRCLWQLNQRLWIFAAFGDAFLLWQATKSSAATLSWDDNCLKMCLLCTYKSSIAIKEETI